MIIVTGSVTAKPDSFEELKRLGLEHVHRSLGEPGCILHSVHVDCENPMRLVFIEKWADKAALKAHFAVPASQDFVRRATKLAAAADGIEIYETMALTRDQILA